MDKRILAGAGLLLACALGVLVATRYMSTAPDDMVRASGGLSSESEIPAPSPEPVSKSAFLGVVVARESVDLAPKFDSRLERVEVRAGDQVRRGARLAVLDVGTVRQDLGMAEAGVRSAEADRDQATLEVAEATARLARLRRVTQLVSNEQIQTAEYQVKAAAARLERAEAQATERRARVDQLRETIADAEIRAPFDGVVAARHLDPGTTVTRGTPILRIISPGTLWVRFAAPAERALKIKPGDQVTVRLEGTDLALTGSVESIAPEIDSTLQMVVIEARLAIDVTREDRVSAGAIARVSLR